jgi:hypothetical protein
MAMTDQERIRDFCEWVIETCLLFGCSLSTAFQVAADYALDYERKDPR